ncbi:MAG: SH3 domain-containing protein [Proteobacteria bacterium]|nr:SH3 domain-containing protein [Pseudomonadota bacterium]
MILIDEYKQMAHSFSQIGHLKESNKNVPEIGEGDDFLNNWLRVKNRNTLLKRSPSLRSEVLSNLDPGYPVMITGVTKGWYRIRLPNDNNGYVSVNDLEIMYDPIQTLFLNKGLYLTADPGNDIIPIVEHTTCTFKSFLNSRTFSSWEWIDVK